MSPHAQAYVDQKLQPLVHELVLCKTKGAMPGIHMSHLARLLPISPQWSYLASTVVEEMIEHAALMRALAPVATPAPQAAPGAPPKPKGPSAPPYAPVAPPPQVVSGKEPEPPKGAPTI